MTAVGVRKEEVVSSRERPTTRTVLAPVPTVWDQVTLEALVAEVDAAASKAMAAEAVETAPAMKNAASTDQKVRVATSRWIWGYSYTYLSFTFFVKCVGGMSAQKGENDFKGIALY